MRIIFCVGLLGCAAPAMGHEYWIEPNAYQVPIDGKITANLVNGQVFKGVTLPYLPRQVARLTLTVDDTTTDIAPRMGDLPAITVTPTDPGLHILAHETAPAVVRYNGWDSFQEFVDHKGFDGDRPGRTRAQHEARALPLSGFSETYTRHVKSLIAVGDGAGSDRALGLATEFVALENPMRGDMSDGLDLLLLWDGAPRAQAQVELFERSDDGAVHVSLHRTDGAGQVTLPVAPGHSYLVDAVVLTAPAPDLAQQSGAVWHSLWAGLTFAVP